MTIRSSSQDGQTNSENTQAKPRSPSVPIGSESTEVGAGTGNGLQRATERATVQVLAEEARVVLDEFAEHSSLPEPIPIPRS